MTLDLFAKVSIPTPGNHAEVAGQRGGPSPLRKAGGQEGAATPSGNAARICVPVSAVAVPGGSHDCARCGLLMVLIVGRELPTLCFDCSPIGAA